MVGVPGKYKGCETCRRRRVKCTNERPHCGNCISSGRECEGYERDRVFIIGTPATKGRVASHPKKMSSSRSPTPIATLTPIPADDWSSRSSASPRSPRSPRPQNKKKRLRQAQPLTSAWEDVISLTDQDMHNSVMMGALQTDLDSVHRQYVKANADTDAGFNISVPPYAPEFPKGLAEDEFATNTHCLARLGSSESGDESNNYCVFLFEHNASLSPNNFTPDQTDVVKSLGPSHFSTFPNHHYFVRVYRPMAISIALLGRRGTFLASPEWTTAPWMYQPKSMLDQLFDIILYLPSIFVQADEILPLQPAMARNVRCQDILQTCLTVDAQFQLWWDQLISNSGGEFPYWQDDAAEFSGDAAFKSPFHFKNGQTGLVFLYFWMSQTLFHRCIESLQVALVEPMVDAYSEMWPQLPQNLLFDPARYQDRATLAANICRSLDSTLDCISQPDMLLAPMTVALDYFGELNATSQDGMLEILWLENFRRRLVARGQHVANVLQDQGGWIEVATY